MMNVLNRYMLSQYTYQCMFLMSNYSYFINLTKIILLTISISMYFKKIKLISTNFPFNKKGENGQKLMSKHISFLEITT